MEELIKLDSYPIKGLVQRLLQDKTTRKNIMFASDSYADYGAGYRDDSQMTEGVLLGFDSCDIQPRVYKAAAEQTQRTRKRAEVFTPAWIVNQMNNHCDAEWFGRPDVFNRQDGQGWTVSTEPIIFPEGKNWKQYVDSRRLEITCGEAPYIVSRYDTSTGKIIPIEKRIGFLDRKLRVINENVTDEAEWFKWALRAFQSVYGYEYQGDSLLIARMNLLYTLSDYIGAKWKRQATQKELKKFLNVICWNIWQMDGMNDTPPCCVPTCEAVQMSFFEDAEPTEYIETIYCKVYDWRADTSKLFKDIKKRGKGMKFDFVIGNPPYQENITEETNQAKPIYHFFVDESTKICNKQVILITPARWYSGGIGLDDFRNRMISEGHISRLVDFPNAKECFPNISIGGGVCYFVWSKDKRNNCTITNVQNGHETTMTRALNEFPILVRYNNAITIIRKANAKNNGSIQEYISSVSPFGISTKTRGESQKDNEHKIRLFSSKGISYLSENEVTKGIDYLGVYKVLLSQTGAEHAGEPAKDGRFNVLSSTMRVLEPMDVCTHSYLVVGKFNNSDEPTKFIKYLKTKFVRVLVLQTISSIHITKGNFTFVPLQDFTENSDIDWTQTIPEIDRQLYAKYGLSEQETDFIETHVKEMN